MNKIKSSNVFQNAIFRNSLIFICLASAIVLAYSFFNGNTNQREWMEGRIQMDLGAFREIRIEELDTLEGLFLEKNVPFMRIKINQGTASYECPQLQTKNPLPSIYKARVDGYISYFKKIQDNLPDTDFIIALDDGFDEKILEGINAPVFCVSKLKSQTKVVAIPELFLFPNSLKTFEKVNRRSYAVGWDGKLEMGYWRGATTGGMYNLENWMHFLRTKLVELSHGAPGILDCAFTSTGVQSTSEAEEIMRNAGFFKKATSPSSQINYKYLIAIDGNTFASSLKWQLFSNSVVLKNESQWMEWYDTALIPYKHYIPYQIDFSDLLHQIEWLKKNDAAAKSIAREARSFAEQNFSAEGIELYVCKLLAAYSALLKPSDSGQVFN